MCSVVEQSNVAGVVCSDQSADTSKPDVGTGVVSMEMNTPVEEKVEVHGSKEERTVFVSNLSPRVTKENLEERFSEVCSIFIATVSC